MLDDSRFRHAINVKSTEARVKDLVDLLGIMGVFVESYNLYEETSI